MAREIALSFALGARLQSGFTAAFQSASSQAKAVSQAIRDMERTPVGKIGAAMSTQQEKIRGLSGSLKDARGELDGLWQRASQAGTMTTVMARQIEQAEARVRRLSPPPSHVASITAKIISKSNVLSSEKFSGKYILDNEWIIIFQFE